MTPEQADPARRKSRWLGALVLAAGVVLVLVFGIRAWHQVEFNRRVQSGEIRVETLRGWMTLPYIARTYRVPEAELRAALALPPTGHEERSLREWFEAGGIDPGIGRRKLEDVIVARGSAP